MIFASCLPAPLIHSLKSTLVHSYQLDEAACVLMVDKLICAPASVVESFIAVSALICLTPFTEQRKIFLYPYDALFSAPQTHRLLFENECVRILESRINPGESVPLHTHQWDSIYITLQGSHFHGIDPDGNRVEEEWGVGVEQFVGDTIDSPLYTYTNIGSQPFLSLAFEIKK